MKKIDRIIKHHGYRKERIIQILNDIQSIYNYLPKDVLEYAGQRLGMPLSGIYSIATFYSAFSLKPRGEHLVTVCMGTACHVRGAPSVLSRLEDRLRIETGGTTEDNQFTLKTVNCLGACALAPIVVVDDEYHGQTTVNKVDRLLKEYEKKKKD
ncbi:MAG: NAD(P)H-dependent oxidoreductase subunit E [candidate division WOR-3 bacterium]|nr:MAG: NAD(P)H-dependent oxidoreductase subunit E [candidate division WOR-3 bacterium]